MLIDGEIVDKVVVGLCSVLIVLSDFFECLVYIFKHAKFKGEVTCEILTKKNVAKFVSSLAKGERLKLSLKSLIEKKMF